MAKWKWHGFNRRICQHRYRNFAFWRRCQRISLSIYSVRRRAIGKYFLSRAEMIRALSLHDISQESPRPTRLAAAPKAGRPLPASSLRLAAGYAVHAGILSTAIIYATISSPMAAVGNGACWPRHRQFTRGHILARIASIKHNHHFKASVPCITRLFHNDRIITRYPALSHFIIVNKKMARWRE